MKIFTMLIAVGSFQSETIVINTREMVGVQDREQITRGTCDGQAASLTIANATRERPGRLVLRAGSVERELPPSFLDGSFVTNGLYHTGIACDGRRVQVSGLAIRDDGDEVVLVRQNAVLDMRTGALRVSELRRLTPAETRSELTAGHHRTIDSSGRLEVPR